MTDWRLWAKGLVAAAIGGAATVLTGYVAGASWQIVAKMAIASAAVNVGTYLKQSPLPAQKG